MQQFGSRMKPMHIITTRVHQVSFQYSAQMGGRRFQIHLSTNSIRLLNKHAFLHKYLIRINLMHQSLQLTITFSKTEIEELLRQKVAQKLDGDLLIY